MEEFAVEIKTPEEAISIRRTLECIGETFVIGPNYNYFIMDDNKNLSYYCVYDKAFKVWSLSDYKNSKLKVITLSKLIDILFSRRENFILNPQSEVIIIHNQEQIEALANYYDVTLPENWFRNRESASDTVCAYTPGFRGENGIRFEFDYLSVVERQKKFTPITFSEFLKRKEEYER